VWTLLFLNPCTTMRAGLSPRGGVMVGDKSCPFSPFFLQLSHRFAASIFGKPVLFLNNKAPSQPRQLQRRIVELGGGMGATGAEVDPPQDFICGLQSHVKDPCSTRLTLSCSNLLFFFPSFFCSFRAFFCNLPALGFQPRPR
jgi:hypothetical protein